MEFNTPNLNEQQAIGRKPARGFVPRSTYSWIVFAGIVHIVCLPLLGSQRARLAAERAKLNATKYSLSVIKAALDSFQTELGAFRPATKASRHW